MSSEDFSSSSAVSSRACEGFLANMARVMSKSKFSGHSHDVERQMMALDPREARLPASLVRDQRSEPSRTQCLAKEAHMG